MLLASATFVLIFVGGLVKSTGSELSVPDWPLAFGKLIPSLQGGVLFEYSHRVVAGIVSILTLTLMLWAILREPRYWVRVLAIVAFALVITQAILGGITVLFLIPLTDRDGAYRDRECLLLPGGGARDFHQPMVHRCDAAPGNSASASAREAFAITTGVIYLANHDRRADASSGRGTGDSRFSHFVRASRCRRSGMSSSRLTSSIDAARWSSPASLHGRSFECFRPSR